ncbi:MAG: hypothetical protein M1830_009489 [Pleopsidium flavum]|nr:MAG: hypothetical protein M1830_009489 [Pleopsidium flavum]
MDETRNMGDKTWYRHRDDRPYERSSPASPLMCSHVVESDFAALIDVALQTSNGDSRTEGSVMKSSSTLNDPVRTLQPEVPSSEQSPATGEPEPRLCTQPPSQIHVLDAEGSYFAPKHLLNHPTYLSHSSTTSTDSSPVQSSYASSSSLHSSQPTPSDYGAILLSPQERPGVLRDLSSFSTASTQTVVGPSRTFTARPPTSAPRTVEATAASKRLDGPVYPNQAFSVLQSQFYPPPYQPHPLRTRSSHPSQHTTYSSSAASSRHSGDNPDMKPGSRTVGNTPSPSPALFSPSIPSPGQTSETDDESHYSSPFLHPSHRQAPKETHKAEVEIDPISGRKLVNNYEILNEIGRGEHGKVKLGRDLTSGNTVAIKIVQRFSKRRRLGKLGSPEDKVKKEVAILKKARHPHVVGLLEVIDDPELKKVYIVLEYVELGEIMWRRAGSKEITSLVRKRVMCEREGFPNDPALLAEEEDYVEQLQLRRAQKARRLHRSQREDLQETAAPFWSLEHGGESEEELSSEADILSRAATHESVASTTVSRHHRSVSPRVATSCPSSPGNTAPPPLEMDIGPLDSENEEEPASARRPNQTASGLESQTQNMSLADLEGTMYGSYAPENFRGRSLSITSGRIRNEHLAAVTPWTHEDEEFSYVPCLTISQAREAFRDTVLGLEYLHYQGIIHRDIKPANLLWTATHRVKISDFGVSYLGKPIRDDDTEPAPEEDTQDLDEAVELAKTVGTPAFYAPELCDTDLFETKAPSDRPQITGQIDVWALGITLYGMIFGRLPFSAEDEFQIFRKIAKDEVHIPTRRLKAVEARPASRPTSRAQIAPSTNSNKRGDDELSYDGVGDDLCDLLKRLLHKDPAKRITLKEVKVHPWVVHGISDRVAWIEETDPSRQSQGKKIEVSNEEIAGAVVNLSLVQRMTSGVRKFAWELGFRKNREGRRRAPSSATSAEAGPSSSTSSVSTVGKEGRRPSLRGDESIFTALKASREGGEHPLAQSVTASPEIKEDDAYFDQVILVTPQKVSTGVIPRTGGRIHRPNAPERAISTAESTKTIKAPMSSISNLDSPPPPQGLPSTPTVIDAMTIANLGGLFGGAGRRIVRSMRSRERRQGADLSSRSSSVDGGLSSIDDPHASPSIAFSNAVAAGHVDTPPVLRERPSTSPVDHHTTMPHQAHHLPSISTLEAFQHAERQDSRRQQLKIDRASERTGSRTSLIEDCLPSPDDEIFFAKQHEEDVHRQQAEATMMNYPQPPPPMFSSSSEDHFMSGMSQSTSHPSIPSVMSGASSLSTAADEGQHQKDLVSVIPPLLRTHDTVTNVSLRKILPPVAVDDVEEGYIGDGDRGNDGDDDDDGSDDEGITFGPKNQKKKAVQP